MSVNIGDYIGPYCITENFRVAGGRSRISFAQQGGKRWFVKEFLSPKYPTPDSPGSAKTKEYKRKMCEEFEEQQRKIMKITKDACSSGSNLICAKDLILKDASYYKISEAIDTTTMLPEDVAKLPTKDIMSIIKSLCQALRILHLNNIVHGDLKPENIIIKKSETTGSYYAKLIDFDDSYFSGKPNENREMIVGTPEYYSPEVFAYITDEDEVIPGSALTCASDIYTLGLLFCEYLTGNRPEFNVEKHRYAYMASTSGETLIVPNHKNVTEQMRNIISNMLSRDFSARPTINDIVNWLKMPETHVEMREEKPIEGRVEEDVMSAPIEAPKPLLRFGKKLTESIEKISFSEPAPTPKPTTGMRGGMIFKSPSEPTAKRMIIHTSSDKPKSMVGSKMDRPRLIINSSAKH